MTKGINTVSDRAREAAADRLQGGRSAIDTYTARTIESVRQGKLDGHAWVQAFATFESTLRKEIVEECARERFANELVEAVESLIPLIWIAQGDTASAETVERARTVLFKAKAANESHRIGGETELLRMLIAADEEAAPNGIMDCVDNDGHPYQSAAMAGLIVHARLIAEPYDHASSIRQLSMGPFANPTPQEEGDGA